MKIESSSKPAAAFVNKTQSAASGKANAPAAEEVRVSPLAAQLSGVDDAPAFDAVRVSEIKQAISEGRFTINAGFIADRLIASAKELVDSQRQA